MSERELEEREIERLQRTALKKKNTNQPTTVPKWKQQQNNPPPVKKVEPVKKVVNHPTPVNSSSYVETEQPTKNENIIVECSPFLKSNPQDNKNDLMDREMQRLMGYTNVPVNSSTQSNGEQNKDEEKIIEERSPFIKEENKDDDEEKELQRLMGYKTNVNNNNNVTVKSSNPQQDKPSNKNENVIVEETSPFIQSNKNEDQKKNEMMEREMQRLMGYTNIPVDTSDEPKEKVEPPKKGDNIFVSLLPFITSKPQENMFDVKETKITDEEREMNRLLGYSQNKKNSV